jgi:hypothetical protein
LWKKETGDGSEYPWGYYRGKIEIGIKEMTTWVTLPRDFTKNCFKKVFKGYRNVVDHVLNMLYGHEKVFQNKLSIEPPLLQAILAYLLHIVPLRWFASTIPQCTHGFVPGIYLVRLQ